MQTKRTTYIVSTTKRTLLAQRHLIREPLIVAALIVAAACVVERLLDEVFGPSERCGIERRGGEDKHTSTVAERISGQRVMECDTVQCAGMRKDGHGSRVHPRVCTRGFLDIHYLVVALHPSSKLEYFRINKVSKTANSTVETKFQRIWGPAGNPYGF
ncbi:hypothetical protein B0H14DRAFT_3778696 [Mycena olivaceomarginata]|nr:hypothetical protein B0H14DRAFT_3778696 [Mycena olivaceomarginata]